MEDFVTYEIAKKLKEKGFTCEYPFAMYTEYEQFCPLYSSDKYYFGIDNFDKHDYIAPTISQVLKWLREEKNIEVVASFSYSDRVWGYQVGDMTLSEDSILAYDYSFSTYEQATIEGIKYVVDNLI